MPYITEGKREEIDLEIEELLKFLPDDDGVINYTITRIVDHVYGKGGYAVFNRAMGVLDCVAREFYRRKVAPYEDKKIEENGDVYN